MSNIVQDMIATKAVVGKRAGVPCILNQGAAMQQCNSNISVHIIPIAPRISEIVFHKLLWSNFTVAMHSYPYSREYLKVVRIKRYSGFRDGLSNSLVQ